MSWSTSNPHVTVDDFLGAPMPGSCNSPDQYAEAKAAAVEVIKSGVIGNPDTHKFSVSMSGHSNPDHEPASGYANDCVSIHISQASG